EVFDCRRVAVGSDQSRQRLDQMPGRAVDARLVARMNVPLRPTAPFLSARNQFQLYYSLGAKVNGDGTIQRLNGHRHENTVAFAQCRQDIRALDDLRKVW